MYTESGEKEASKRRRTKKRGTTEEKEFQTKAATMCAKIVERSARREISAERGGRTAEITLKRKNGTQESETATQSTADARMCGNEATMCAKNSAMSAKDAAKDAALCSRTRP